MLSIDRVHCAVPHSRLISGVSSSIREKKSRHHHLTLFTLFPLKCYSSPPSSFYASAGASCFRHIGRHHTYPLCGGSRLPVTARIVFQETIQRWSPPASTGINSACNRPCKTCFHHGQHHLDARLVRRTPNSCDLKRMPNKKRVKRRSFFGSYFFAPGGSFLGQCQAQLAD